MCEGELVRDPTAPLYPTAAGGALLIPGRSGSRAMSLREVGGGRLVMDAVFRCVPPSPLTPRRHRHERLHRVVIQVRRDVGIQASSVDGPPAALDLDGQVAICAFGDSSGHVGFEWARDEPAYTWVQTGHFRPERVVWFDGRDEQTDLGWRSRERRPAFGDHGQEWWVDSRSPHSARYAAAGAHLTPIGHPNGEIIYDSPSFSVGYANRLGGEPQIRLVETSVQFRTYLYSRPGGYRGMASLDPLAVVEWWHTERWERATAGAAARRTASDVRVLWILPNPVEPPLLDDAIRDFRFR
ncbi:MAG: hypothetical protein M5U28_12875 [Sandaracinaceae bacterium]|nr:hypothetical protein [Sandaracinaceae bacterium]